MLPEVVLMNKTMMAHGEQGRLVMLKQWTVTIADHCMMERDGVLGKLHVVKIATIQPGGICECSQCGRYVPMGARTDNQVYVDNTMTNLYCMHCSDQAYAPFQMNILQADLAEIQSGMPKATTYRFIFTDYKDLKKTALPYYQTQYPDLVYIKNKNAKNLYHDMLAKRVLRIWQRKVLQRRVASVLYTCASVGKDAAFVLASKVH